MSELDRAVSLLRAHGEQFQVLVDQLESGGYVERVPDPTDGRARLVRATRRGEDVIALAGTVERAIEQEWRDHLGEPATAELERALVLLREITDPFA